MKRFLSICVFCCSSTSSSPTAHHVYRRTNAPMLMCFNHYHTTVKNCLSLFTFLLFFYFSHYFICIGTHKLYVCRSHQHLAIFTLLFSPTQKIVNKNNEYYDDDDNNNNIDIIQTIAKNGTHKKIDEVIRFSKQHVYLFTGWFNNKRSSHNRSGIGACKTWCTAGEWARIPTEICK